MRWLGGGLILLAAALARAASLAPMRAAQRARTDTADALERLAQELLLTLLPLPRLVGRDASPFCRAAAALLMGGASLAAGWRAAAQGLPLPETERRMLADASARLDGEAESVAAALRACAGALRRAYERAEETRRTQERISGVLCISTGILLLILLI